jgi:hypothetical protein
MSPLSLYRVRSRESTPSRGPAGLDISRVTGPVTDWEGTILHWSDPRNHDNHGTVVLV